MNKIRMVFVLLISMGLAACGSESPSGIIEGEYGGSTCVYSKMIFKGDGKVNLTTSYRELPGIYKIVGDKLIVEDEERALAFTIEGDAFIYDNKYVCTKK